MKTEMSSKKKDEDQKVEKPKSHLDVMKKKF